MRVLMFGWEFPPHSQGGLGTACYGLTKGLAEKGVKVTLVLPKGPCSTSSHLDMIIADNLYIGNRSLKMSRISTLLTPYMSSSQYDSELRKITGLYQDSKDKGGDIYGRDLFAEVERYSDKAQVIANFEDFDVIHAHDWMTFKAGMKAKKVSGKPLVVHVHATEFDRTGGHPNQHVYNIEREGMHNADKVIAVSNYTKDKITTHYGVPGKKVKVVHNAIYFDDSKSMSRKRIGDRDKVVLFLGRLTLQKGPDYFIETAKRVLSYEPDAKFVVAGAGDMYYRMVERAAELGIGNSVLFTGHLHGDDVEKAFKMADLYVMPSVSEPFGIAPLEALKNNVPVMISKQSGVSEVLNNALKVDFWDIDEMTNKILGVLRYKSLKDTLTAEGSNEIKKLKWSDAAQKCIEVYDEVRR